MDFLDQIMDHWKRFCGWAQPGIDRFLDIVYIVGEKLISAVRYMAKMRKVFMAIPVGVAAVYLAIYNEAHLPAIVAIGLENSGEAMFEVIRELAVLGPLAVTAACLLLMFCSRRILTPWFVSVVSLAIPVMVLLSNIFPS